MTLNLSGSTGVSGVDGSAATPALQGSDTNTGISFGTDVIIASTDGSERARIDSSGRLLVGTSSVIANTSTALIQSNSQIIAPQGVLTGGGGWSMMPPSKVTLTQAADSINGHTVAIDISALIANSRMFTFMVSFIMNRGNTDAAYSQTSQYLGQWIIAQSTNGLQAAFKADIVVADITITNFTVSSNVVTLTFNTPNVRGFRANAVQYYGSTVVYPAA